MNPVSLATEPTSAERPAPSLAAQVAQALLAGFDRHYHLFRQISAQAKARFESADWHGQQRAQRDRIEFYDLRVADAAQTLEQHFHVSQFSVEVWQEVKLHYIGLLTEHLQPELAETFFNSVTTKLLHRRYFHNDFIFIRPAVSTEYIETIACDHRPTFRVYYPSANNVLQVGRKIVDDFDLKVPFADLDGDILAIWSKVRNLLDGELDPRRLRANFQIQVLSSLFFRNKGAYIVGRLINGYHQTAFALPILHNDEGLLIVDALLHGEDDLVMLFSFARAYFMVDMDVPSGYVQFLRSLMPRKPKSEIYSALGLQKQGKNLFYRDFLSHLGQSSDDFRIAPGIKGMVMLVFDLPSFPFVFKCIKDFYPAPKDTSRELIKSKYLLVKQHDRVGRMADTLEFSNVAFPRERFTPELLAELRHFCPSLLEEEQNFVVIRHVYIERRMIPLNIYIQESSNQDVTDAAVIEYGNAIKDLVAANIFPGDMLWKNFGVMRQGKVVFYDYDEIEYITDCQFRKVPEPRNEEEEMSGEIWYHVGAKDVFPETFGPFLLGNPKVRSTFMRHHSDLLSAEFWQSHKDRIAAGQVLDVFPYEQGKRLRPL